MFEEKNPPKKFVILYRNSVLKNNNSYLFTAEEVTKCLALEVTAIKGSLARPLGMHGGTAIYLVLLERQINYAESFAQWTLAKPYFDSLPPDEHFPLFAALHLSRWHMSTQYCGHCSELLSDMAGELFGKNCANGHVVYPSYSIAIIVMLYRTNTKTDQREILMIRNDAYPKNLYTHIAGFVDPGEGFEAAVLREIQEEVGIKVADVQYYGNQSWPFPAGHMVAFTAEYESGDVLVDGNEVTEARWFSVEEIKKTQFPVGHHFSISTQLTNDFLQNHHKSVSGQSSTAAQHYCSRSVTFMTISPP